MTFILSLGDPRSRRALALLATAGQWGKFRGHDGSKCFAIPSQTVPGLYHLANCRSCTCADATRSGLLCKHSLAVRLYCA